MFNCSELFGQNQKTRAREKAKTKIQAPGSIETNIQTCMIAGPRRN